MTSPSVPATWVVAGACAGAIPRPVPAGRVMPAWRSAMIPAMPRPRIPRSSASGPDSPGRGVTFAAIEVSAWSCTLVTGVAGSLPSSALICSWSRAACGGASWSSSVASCRRLVRSAAVKEYSGPVL